MTTLSLADLAERMAAEGAPLSAILLAIRAIEDARHEGDAKREKDRERKRARNFHGNSVEIPQTVHGNSGDLSPQETFQPLSEPTSLDQNPTLTPYRSPALAKPNGFARFWEAYPHKVGKRAAETAYDRALRRADAAAILAGVGRAGASRQWGEGFIPNPATWLNQDRWLDEPDETARVPPLTGGLVAALARQQGARMFLEADDDGGERHDFGGTGGAVIALPRAGQVAR